MKQDSYFDIEAEAQATLSRLVGLATRLGTRRSYLK